MILISGIPDIGNAQNRTISGRVKSNDGTALQGATVSIKNLNINSITNENGLFSITTVLANPVILVSYVGKISKEIAVGNNNFLDIELSDNPSELSNVVVIGYGTIRKSDLTGSVSSVSASDIKSVPSTTIDQALQGKAAGVQVTQMSGKPGAETSIRIRGTSSINAGNEPLYVIDGILMNSDGGDMSVGGTRGPRISPFGIIKSKRY
ncbi:MAG: TonB-dependent receptor plug domain-containing protein [Sphingobacteriales bacterium]|nr:TonB-dependent receptor plug domain-containing protein [Sphingobacteriales bacterium]